MLHIQRGLSILIIFALLAALLGNALPLSAESALPFVQSEAVSKDAATAQPPQPNAPTASGPSMYLNGASYVNVPQASLPAVGGSDLMLEAWIYPANVTGYHAVFGKRYPFGYWFGVYNGKLRFFRGSSAFVESTATIPINRWTHIAVNSYFDPWENAYWAEFYINGDLDGYQIHTGAAAVNDAYDLHIGNDLNTEYFVGDIAEARLWLGIRGSESIRRDMHAAITEKRSGLVADWHLAGDYKDSINGSDGTPVGSPAFVGYPSPAQPLVAQTDRFFNTLPQNTYAAAAAFVPRLNRAVVAGGYRNSVPSAVITAIDAGSGVSSNLGTLPAPRGYATAAYATSNDTVYVFGGSDQLATTNSFDTIYAINPETGAVRTVAATLPGGRNNATAIYLDHLNKIVILGGWYYDPAEQYADSVYVFDVASETIATASFTLPQPGYGLAAAYSPLTQKVYYFGGSTGAVLVDTAYELTLNADSSGAITPLTVKLPVADAGGGAVEDPVTHLIYIVNGVNNANIVAFDPTSNELWRTPIELPRDDAGNLLIRPYSSVIYSPRQRHALVIGGGYYTTSGANNVWRIPLGDGPSMPIGHWDSIPSGLGNIDYMSSVYWRVAMGRKNSAAKYFDFDYTVDYPGNLNATGLGQLTTMPDDGTTWFSTWNGNTVNIKRDTGSAIETRYTETRVAPIAADAPDAVVPYNNHTPFFGSGTNLKWQNISDYLLGTWHDSFVGTGPANNWQWTHIPAIAHRNFSEAWAIIEPWYYAPARPGSAPEAGGPTPTRPQLGRLYYEYYGTNYAENLYGFPCGTSLWASDLVFGNNGDWWIGGQGGVCRYANAYPPSSGYGGNLFVPTIGNNVVKLSVDGDGRIWAALMPDAAGNTGGLTAYEVLSTTNSPLGTVRTQDWNWLTAPIGSLTSVANGWNSGIRALTANGERVWMALNTDPNSGPLVMYSPRWQQLTGANEGSLWGVRKVFLARGRAFFATNGDRLVTLQPDGVSWDDRGLAGVKAVIGDSKGRIWIGASDGVRRWTPTGWDMIDGALGTSPTGPINAIAVDSKNRMWIGGENGLTLFDRERWVTTIQPPQGAISVTAVLVDRDDNVWVGTTQGLGKLNTTDQSWTTYTTADNLYTNNIFDIAQLGDGQIAVSTGGTGGGLSLFNGTTFAKQTYPPGKDQPLTADQTGRLWAGAIQREPTGYYGRFWTNSGLVRSEVVDNASDGANLVWFAHPSGGVSIRSAFLPSLADVQPQISPSNGVVPNRGSQGDTVVINGSGFGSERTAVEVIIGGAPADISSVTDNQITLKLTGANLTGDVTVRRGKHSVTLGGGTTPAFCAVPKISSMTPTGGNVGVELQITGSNFDPTAAIQLGSGPARPLGFRGAGMTSVWIRDSDMSGDVVVRNVCANATATFNDFRKINLSIGKVMINQGYGAMGLLASRATLVSVFLIKDQQERPSDRLQVDNLEVNVVRTSDLASIFDRTIPVAAGFPAALGSFSPGFTSDISQALNMPMVFLAPGDMRVDVRLSNRAAQVASAAPVVNVARNYDINVLLVPIVPDGFSATQMDALKSKVDRALYEPDLRLMPTGGIFFRWAKDVMYSDPVDIGSDNYLTGLRKYAIGLDRIRQRTNSGYGTKYDIVLGMVAQGHNTSSTPGSSFRPETSADANFWLGLPDALCDFENDVVHTVSLGLLGSDDGCHLDYPVKVGWVEAKDGPDSLTQDTLGRVISHELGHILNLVDDGTANYDSSNEDHSQNDEISNGTCTTMGATLDQSRTLIQADNIAGPVVNPVRGTQLRQTDMGNLSSDKRPKAIMSYGCGRKVYNSFFEPADLAYEQSYQNMTGLLRQLTGLRNPESPTLTTAEPIARVIPGPRLHVSGLITTTGTVASGTIDRVETLDDDAPISAPILTDYWLVQRNADGAELMRWPVVPAFSEIEEDPAAPNAPAYGFFGVTMTRTQDLASIDLYQDSTLLATFAAGTNPPAVSLTSPIGGENFANGTVPVAWTAADPDNDPLEVSIDFSSDNGQSWQPVSAANGSGTLDIPVEQLQGTAGATGRIRVVASDGLTHTVASSGAFTIAPQPPQAVILNPVDGSTALESQTISLNGQGINNQQEILTSTNQLTWFSNHDGLLGTGSPVNILLSVGTHTITLEAKNSAGLTATADITLTVAGDYDGDGVSDEVEASNGLNPLTAVDELGDTDGDGLINSVERGLGTDPNNPDSDGDGRVDGEEIEQGSDPLVIDQAPAPDHLTVSPVTLVFTADLSVDMTIPQRGMQILSGSPTTWTVTSNAAWVKVYPSSGTTPAQPTVMIDPSALNDGVYNAALTFDSMQLNSSVDVPLSVTVANKVDYCDANRDGETNQADVNAVQARVGAAQGDANYAIAYDLNRDGLIDAQDVALISTCVVIYGDVRALYLPLIRK